MQQPSRTASALLLASLAVPAALWFARSAGAQGQPPAQGQPRAGAPSASDPISRIRAEEMERSQVMETLSYLTDVIGPRLTASPGLKRANEWTRTRLEQWGLTNAKLEPWGTFGRGWTLERFSAQVVEPQAIPLIAYPKAWSPGTDGAITRDVIYFDVKDVAGFSQYKGKLKGAIVLVDPPREIKAHFEPEATRRTDTQLLELANAGPTAPRRTGAGRETTPEERAQFEVSRRRLAFLIEEGAAVMLECGRGDGGNIFVAGAAVPQPPPVEGESPFARRVSAWQPDAPKTVTQLVVSAEQYNRMVRMIRLGEKLKMNVDLKVRFQDKDLLGYNTIAEIPGTDLKDEVVMLGGHLDSWHGGTGATDNAAGVAVCMEAVRLLKALGLQPRRTVRIALWTGEEQGLFGSRAYVAQHFRKAPPANARPGVYGEKLPDFEKLSVYFNLDTGTGKVRGMTMGGNEGVRSIFRDWFAPFNDLGAQTLTAREQGSTDHIAFTSVNLPGFTFIQDPVEYSTRTHHSTQDVYDRIQADDMKQASMIMAAFVYQAAMRDQKLPRKPE